MVKVRIDTSLIQGVDMCPVVELGRVPVVGDEIGMIRTQRGQTAATVFIVRHYLEPDSSGAVARVWVNDPTQETLKTECVSCLIQVGTAEPQNVYLSHLPSVGDTLRVKTIPGVFDAGDTLKVKQVSLACSQQWTQAPIVYCDAIPVGALVSASKTGLEIYNYDQIPPKFWAQMFPGYPQDQSLLESYFPEGVIPAEGSCLEFTVEDEHYSLIIQTVNYQIDLDTQNVSPYVSCYWRE